MLELSRDEIGSTAVTTEVLAGDIVDLFTHIGLPTPQLVTVISIEHQMVQKLHACADGVPEENDRAHDPSHSLETLQTTTNDTLTQAKKVRSESELKQVAPS